MPIFNVKKLNLNEEKYQAIISNLGLDNTQVPLSSGLKAALEGGIILSRTFYEWKGAFLFRKRITMHREVDVSNDPEYVFVETSIFEKIKNTGAEYIVAKFGCDGAPNYTNLTLYFCGMNKPDTITNETEIYKASLTKGSPATSATLADMRTAIGNFRARNRILVSASLPYFAEIEGVAHRSDNIITFATDSNIAEFAIHFGVELRNGTTIMLLDSSIDSTRAASVVDNDDVYDHGTGCCPIP